MDKEKGKTVGEFIKELTEYAQRRPEILDMPLVVSIYTGLNTCPSVPITYVGEGFDWGSGRVFIETGYDLIDKRYAHHFCQFLSDFRCPIRSHFAFEHGLFEQQDKLIEDCRKEGKSWAWIKKHVRTEDMI